jgi:hypothetical protein
MKRLLAILSLLCFAAITTIAATDVLDYEKRVKRASEQIERIKSDESYAEEAIPYVKETLVPKHEEVEIKGQTITVDNTWLHIKLDSYSNAKDKQEKGKLLIQIRDSLKELDNHLREAAGIKTDGKAESKQEIEERVRRILSEEQYREKQESYLTKKIREIRKQITDAFQKILTKIFRAIGGASRGTSWLLIVLLAFFVGIIGYLAYNYFTKRGRVKKPKKKTVLGEEIAEDATPSDLANAALIAAKGGDFRLGIRKLYIAYLYELSERGLIELDAHATNREYLAKVSRFSSLTQPMRYLTDNFDYFWYGMFPSSKEDFSNYLIRYREAVLHAQRLSAEQPQSS